MATVVSFLGGTGTQVGTTYPACILKSLWDNVAYDATDFMGTNGEALTTVTGVSITDNGDNTFNIDDTGSFSTTLVGMFAYISSGAVGYAGYYEVVAVNSADDIDVSDTALNGLGTLTAESVNVSIGGSADITTNTGGSTDLQDAWDFLGPAFGCTTGNAINGCELLTNRDVTTDTKLDFDLLTGASYNANIRIRGMSSDYSAESAVTITATAALTTNVLDWSAVALHIELNDLIVDAATYADRCISNVADGVIGGRLVNVECKNADGYGFAMRGNGTVWTCMGCSFHDNDIGVGAVAGGRGEFELYNCKAYDNTSEGIHTFIEAHINNCQIYGNYDGIKCDKMSSFFTMINVSNCTIDGNTNDGINLNETNGTISILVSGCAITNNGGYGINHVVGTGEVRYVGLAYNNFHNNTSGVTNEGSGTLDDIHSRNSFEVAPSYVSTTAGSEDYRLQTTSAMIDIGAMGAGDNIGALATIAGGGGGSNGYSTSTAGWGF